MNLQTIWIFSLVKRWNLHYRPRKAHCLSSLTTAILSIKCKTKFMRLRQTELSNILVTMTLIWSIKKFSSKKQEIITPKVNDYKLRKERESELRKKRTALKRTEEKKLTNWSKKLQNWSKRCCNLKLPAIIKLLLKLPNK